MRWRIAMTAVLMLLAVTLAACHEGDSAFHWITPEAATLLPTVTPTPNDASEAPPLPTVGPTMAPQPTVDPCTLVKGNIDAQGRKLYHVPGMRNFNQVVIDPDKGEKCFATEEEAANAGWTRAGN